jgi:hypothetical protein
MRQYRRRVAENKTSSEINGHELSREIPEAIKSAESANIPEPEIENKSEAITVEQISPEKYQDEIIKADESKAGVAEQLRALQRAEALNRQRNEELIRQEAQTAHAAQLFHYWKQNGLSDENAKFLVTTPVNFIGELTAFVGNEAAQQGPRAGSPEHEAAAQKLFHQHLNHLRDQAVQANGHHPVSEPAMEPAVQETPKFFEPPPAPQPRPQPSRASVVSAPVSREAPGNYQSEFQNDPKSVRLTPEQRDAARWSGVSEIEYARQLLLMRKRQASGETQP